MQWMLAAMLWKWIPKLMKALMVEQVRERTKVTQLRRRALVAEQQRQRA
jgi:hypothetical protein